MIQRIIPVFIGITLLLSGCTKQQSNQHTARFTAGATLLKIAHLPSSIEDGSSLFITVDGKDAGRLPVGKAMLLQVPAGEHEVAGYARSLIGSVTIPGLKVTTSAESPRFVAYRVAQHDPLFMARGIDPLPGSAPIPEKQAAESKPVPLPQITLLGPVETEPTDAAEVAAQDAPPAADSTQEAAEKSTSGAPGTKAVTNSPVSDAAGNTAASTQAAEKVAEETTPEAKAVTNSPASAATQGATASDQAAGKSAGSVTPAVKAVTTSPAAASGADSQANSVGQSAGAGSSAADVSAGTAAASPASDTESAQATSVQTTPAASPP